MIHSVRLAAVLLATVVLASCGDDSDDEGGSPERQPSAGEADARRLARGVLLD
jgi:hypothetical protein